jgi:N-acetylmuramoyl-L-alanine amidase
MRIRQHRLYIDDETTVPFQRSPNQSGSIKPEYLVMHFTRGSSSESAVSWLMNPQAKASAHLVIGRDGSVTQLVAFNRKAWHAGRSRWADRAGLNNCSIGIELDNYGDLIGRPGNWRTAWGWPVADEHVLELSHVFDGKLRGWHAYTESQLLVAARVALALVERYGLKEILGHDDIAPGRKLDPGPAFPMASFRAAVMGRHDDSPEIYETTTALNIRKGPGTDQEKHDVSPLPEGTRLEVLSVEGLWRLVDVLDKVRGESDIIGWVHGRYIRMVG